MIAVFREEVRALSKCKRDLESYLQNIRHQLHLLDSLRKTIKSKISTLSKSLQLDAQSFKVQYVNLILFLFYSPSFSKTCRFIMDQLRPQAC